MAFEKTPPRWEAAGVEPTEEKLLNGWQPKEKIPAPWLNWYFNGVYESLKELQEKAATNAELQEAEQKADEGLSAINGWKTYNDITELGLTAGTETIDDIVQAMPDKSELHFTKFASNTSNIYPVTTGLLSVRRFVNNRVELIFSHGYNNGLTRKWYGWWDVNTTPKFSGWKEVADAGQAQMFKLTQDNGMPKLYLSDKSKDFLTEITSLGIGMHSFFCKGGAVNAPTDSIRGHAMFTEYSGGKYNGYIQGIDYLGNTWINFTNTADGWLGWKKVANTDNAQMSKITLDNGDPEITHNDTSADFTAALEALGKGMHTFYCRGGSVNAPSRSIRGHAFFTGSSPLYGYIHALDYDGDTWTNYRDGNNGWLGWRRIVSTAHEPANLVKNASAGMGMLYWSNVTTDRGTWYTSQVDPNVASCFFTDATAESSGKKSHYMDSDAIRVTAGGTYHVQGLFATAGITAGSAYLEVVTGDKSTIIARINADMNKSWHKKETTFVVPTGISSVVVRLCVANCSTGNKYFSKIKLCRSTVDVPFSNEADILAIYGRLGSTLSTLSLLEEETAQLNENATSTASTLSLLEENDAQISEDVGNLALQSATDQITIAELNETTGNLLLERAINQTTMIGLNETTTELLEQRERDKETIDLLNDTVGSLLLEIAVLKGGAK